MTEEAWQTEIHPLPLIEFLWSRSSDRKLRLFAACCCCSIWKHLKKERSRAAVKASERYAEGMIGAEELLTFRDAAYAAFEEAPGGTLEEPLTMIAADAALRDARQAASSAIDVADLIAHFAAYGQGDELPYSDERQAAYEARKATEHTSQCRLLRDIFGNPFRPVTLDPAWFTSDAVALARGIYDERAFDRMPILADALQDAGCDNDDVLTHCRDTALTHVRGCWVVDLVLGKS